MPEVQRQTLLVVDGEGPRHEVRPRSRLHSYHARVEEYQAAVPVRTYEDFWRDYWQAAFPRLEGTTWPDFIPYYALSSGTTTGTTKYIPISKEMLASNRKAAFTTVALFRHVAPRSADCSMAGSSSSAATPNCGRSRTAAGRATSSAIASIESFAAHPALHVSAARTCGHRRLERQGSTARRSVGSTCRSRRSAACRPGCRFCSTISRK